MENTELMSYFGKLNMNPKIVTIDDLYAIYDIANRELHLNYVISNEIETAEYIVTSIAKWNRADEENGIPIEKRKPIKIYINSFGGEIHEGYSIVDAIEMSKTPVWTINIGVCMSMAFHIFIAGDKRFAFPNAVFLHHDGSDGVADSSSKFQDHAEFLKKFNKDVLKKQVLRCTKISEEVFKKYERVEWYMMPKEAKKYGVLDYIVGENPELDKLVAW